MKVPYNFKQELFRSTLSDNEIVDPFLVLKTFFDNGSLQDSREQFSILKEVVFTESFGELESGAKWLLTEHLKSMERLIDANYLLHKGNERDKDIFKHQETEIAAIQADPDKTAFQKVVDFVRVISDPGKIYKIKALESPSNPLNSRFDFLVLLDTPRISFLEMEKKIELTCQEYGSVIVTFRRFENLSGRRLDPLLNSLHKRESAL